MAENKIERNVSYNRLLNLNLPIYLVVGSMCVAYLCYTLYSRTLSKRSEPSSNPVNKIELKNSFELENILERDEERKNSSLVS